MCEVVKNSADIFAFVVLSVIHICAWLPFRKRSAKETTLGKRTSSARFMASACTAGVIAVSILLPAALVIARLVIVSPDQLPITILDSIFRSSVWFIVSLVLGLCVLYIIPMRSGSYDVSRKFEIGALFGLQLIALGTGIGRFVYAIYLTIYH